MKLVISKPNYQALELKRHLLSGPYTVLDVGCGKNSNLRFIPKKLIKSSVGIDLFEEDIEKAKKSGIHDKYINGDITKLEKYFSPKSFDCVIAMDVVEHLEKNKAEKLIKSMERLASKIVIIGTPNGYVPQAAVDGNIFQVHKCGFSVSDFEKLGYLVKGMDGPKFMRGTGAEINYSPKIIFKIMSNLLDPIFRNFPGQSFSLFAFKYL